jgi:hypothetical protein
MNKKTIWVGALIAASVPVVSALTTFDPAQIGDWRTWAAGLAAASVLSLALYVSARLTAE